MFDIEETMQKLDMFISHIIEAARLGAVSRYRAMTEAEKETTAFHKRSAVSVGTELLLPFVPDAKKHKTPPNAKK